MIGDQTNHIEQVFQDHERFSRTERRIETIGLARLVEKAARLLQHGEAVSLLVAPGIATLPPVRGHAVILTQVFGNLVVNAGEAVLNAGRGTGTITVDGGVVDHTGVDMVEVRFSDNGLGIAPDRLDRIFKRGYSSAGLDQAASACTGAPTAWQAWAAALRRKAMALAGVLPWSSACRPVQEKTFGLGSPQRAPEQVRHT